MRGPKSSAVLGLALALLLGGVAASINPAIVAQSDSRYFPATQHTVRGRFLAYWDQHGGLTQQGYPISEEMQEVSDTDGKTYTVQYFERAVFEWHPENQPPYTVLLSLLGTFEYQRKYPAGAPAQVPNADPGSVLFPQTGKRLGGRFLAYWQAHGGLAQQGYPISGEFTEASALDGKPYTVQYFERAVFEWHPENAGTPYEVLLSQLGTLRYQARYQSLTIPPPAPGHRQFGPRGSDSYLVWGESASLPGGGTVPDSYDLLGLDLKTRQPLIVANGPNNQADPAISGSLVVWDDNQQSCATCARDVRGKDLATEATYAIATGPADQVYPAIAGRTVAWLENDEQAMRIRATDLPSSPTIEIVALSHSSGLLLSNPVLSAGYIVWAQVGASDPNTRSWPIQLRAYARQTGAITTIAAYRQRDSQYPNYAIDGTHVIWDQDGLRIADLQTGESAILTTGEVNTPTIRGDVVIWGLNADVYGLNLRDRLSRPLVTGEGRQGAATVAGRWLVWGNEGGPHDGRLSAMLLPAALASAVRP